MYSGGLKTQVIGLLLFGEVQSCVHAESAAHVDILPAMFKSLITLTELFSEIKKLSSLHPQYCSTFIFVCLLSSSSYVYLVCFKNQEIDQMNIWRS